MKTKERLIRLNFPSLPLEFLRRILYLVPAYPRQVQVEITNRCNLKCRMCPRWTYSPPNEDFPKENFFNVIDGLASPCLVTLTGWGEPFLHPHLFEMIAYAKEREHTVSLTTNGTMLNDFVTDVLKSGLDRIVISIDRIYLDNNETTGHPPVDELLDNIKKFTMMRTNRSKPIISLQTTMHRGGMKDCLDIVRYAGEIGVDRVNLVRLNTQNVDGTERMTLEEEICLYREAEKLGKQLKVRVDTNYAKLDGLMRKFYKWTRPYIYRLDSFCPKTYDYVYVNIEGDVTPCCDLRGLKMGNLFEENLEKIWNGDLFKKFRRNQTKICQKCDHLKLRHLY